MTNTTTWGQLTGFGMPVPGSKESARVRALPTTVGAAVAPAAGSKCVPSTLCVRGPEAGYRHIPGVIADNGAFAGPSAWSPPI